jgi:hypothetical protein
MIDMVQQPSKEAMKFLLILIRKTSLPILKAQKQKKGA